MTEPVRPGEDLAAVRLEEAAALAGVGNSAGAARCALAAASLLPVGHPDRHDALVLGAQLLVAAGLHGPAVAAWSEAVGEASDDTARIGALAGRGEAARLSGRWPEAEAAYREALALAEQTFGPGSVAAAAVAHNLGVTYKYTGRFEQAAALYHRALAVATEAGDDAFAAVICHNLGGLAHARGAHADGEPWARRAVAIRERSGAGPLALAADRGALAGLLVGLGRHEEAESLLIGCRDTFTQVLGPEHHEVGVIETNLAALALARGDLEAAEEHARRALAIKRAALGSTNPELAPTLTTLGTIRRRRGDDIDAVAWHLRALAVLEPVVEADHPLLRTIRANLATARGAQL